MHARKQNQHHSIDFRRDIFAIFFLALGIFIALCLVSYHPSDPAINSVSNMTTVHNLGGLVGSYLADILFTLLGISAYLASAICFIMCFIQMSKHPIHFRISTMLFYIGTIGFGSALIHLRFNNIHFQGVSIPGGGLVGGLIGSIFFHYLNKAGAYLIISACFITCFMMATKISLSAIFNAIHTFISLSANHIKSLTQRVSAYSLQQWKGIYSQIRTRIIPLPTQNITTDAPVKIKSKPHSDEITLQPIRPILEDSTSPNNKILAEKTTTNSSIADTLPSAKIFKRADLKPKKKINNQLNFQHMDISGYTPPPLALLDTSEKECTTLDESELQKNSLLLARKLLDFGVEGKVTAIHPGPVITMYEFEPAAGIKLNKIVNLQDDLSLALSGRSVRILPHLPGKAAVGIEVPNNEREIVWLHDIIASPQYNKQNSNLPIALGSSTSGNSHIVDLAKMPHLLIAGATGSGKSVAINSIILSILYRSSPEDVRFIMVDPKMLELSIYDGIAHLLLPVVTKPKPAVQAMRWAIIEMERRYRLMADTGTRNIVGYNNKIRKDEVDLVTEDIAKEMLSQNKDAIAHTGKLPYIVIIIDELADLMMTASQDMEECITRLAQMARAAGIHLILATQRPSVDVITGLIKANFPARIAFKVTSRHDSRTILDSIGSETLLGQGDMLFMTPQGGNMLRLHGSYLTDSDIARVVTHIKEQGTPTYNENILKTPDKESTVLDDDDADELYDTALKLVSDTKQASISMVQRKLRIGYNRAARMIERMETEGVIGPADGSKPRQVFVNNLNT